MKSKGCKAQQILLRNLGKPRRKWKNIYEYICIRDSRTIPQVQFNDSPDAFKTECPKYVLITGY
jgi:hypothetical protein